MPSSRSRNAPARPQQAGRTVFRRSERFPRKQPVDLSSQSSAIADGSTVGPPDCEPQARARVLGCEFDPVRLDEAVALCERVIDARATAQHMSINVAKLMAMREDKSLRDSVARCELITADGQPLVWVSASSAIRCPSELPGLISCMAYWGALPPGDSASTF